MFPDVLAPDHAVRIYKNHEPLCITFTISKYPSETLGQFLRKLRLERGLTQKQLAEKIGANEMSVVGWENNRRIPRNKKLLALAKFFKVRENTLFNMMVHKTSP